MITSSDRLWIMLIQIICKLFLEQNNVKHTEISYVSYVKGGGIAETGY